MTEPIRVLQVVASLNAGGMENYICTEWLINQRCSLIL